MGLMWVSAGNFVGGIGLGFLKGPLYACALLGIGPPMVIIMGITTSMIIAGSSMSLKAYGQSSGYATQCLTAFKVVVAFGMEKTEIKNYNGHLEVARKAGAKEKVMTGLGMSLMMAMIYSVYSYAFWVGANFVKDGVVNRVTGEIYSFMDILAVFFGILFGLFSMEGMGNAAKALGEAQVAGKLAFDIIDRNPIVNMDDPNAQNHELKGQIEFKNVTFYYPTRADQKILNNLSLTFEMGKTTAIVGPSGSGKSTVIQLIERFYDANEGQVLVDGKDIKDIKLRNYRRQIGYVPQEPIMLNSTVKKNVLLGKPNATDAEVNEALVKTNSMVFVDKLEGKLDAPVGTGGSAFSGGQKQRLALARAFVKKPKMMIFDEATSALDTRNEREVQASIEAMGKELGGVTTVVIAHRLTTIRNADKIIVLKKGVLAEEGNHDHLMSLNGEYAKLVKLQGSKQEAKKK